MIDLEGNIKFFDESTSISWEVRPEVKLSGETTAVAHLYRTRTGHWICWTKFTARSWDSYGISRTDPDDLIVEVTIADAARLMVDPRRPEYHNEPRLPKDLLHYLGQSCIDGGYEAGAGSNYPDFWEVRREIVFCDTVDGLKRSATILGQQTWSHPAEAETSQDASKLCRTEHGTWILGCWPDGDPDKKDGEPRLAWQQLSVDCAVDWFLERRLAVPHLLTEDLDRRNLLIRIQKTIDRMDRVRPKALFAATYTTATLESVEEILTGSSGDLPEPTAARSDGLLMLDDERKVVHYQGAEYPLKETIYDLFQKIARAECRLTREQLAKDIERIDRALKKGLPKPLYTLIDSKTGHGGGYCLKSGMKVHHAIIERP